MLCTRFLNPRHFPIVTGALSFGLVALFFVPVPALDTTDFHIWQLVTYAFAHADTLHLSSNVGSLLVIGSICELVHGSVRTALTLGLSVTGGGLAYANTMGGRVVGASGGVYGLLGAYGAHLVLNFHEVRFRLLWFAALVGIGTTDMLLYIYAPIPNVAYTVHVAGAAYGLLGGIFILKNPIVRAHERALQVAAVGLVVMFYGLSLIQPLSKN